jgi:hypothetical protein
MTFSTTLLDNMLMILTTLVLQYVETRKALYIKMLLVAAKSIRAIIADIPTVLYFINVVLYFSIYKKLNTSLKIITAYLLVTFVIEIVSDRLSTIGVNNLYLSHVYFIEQFLLLSYFYSTLDFSKIQLLFLKISVGVVLTILMIQYILFPKLIFQFNEIEIVLCNFPLIIFSLFHYYNSIGEKTSYPFINMGVLVYLSCSTVVFCSGNLMTLLNMKVNRTIWVFNNIISILFQVLLFVEWYRFYRKTKEVTS